MSRIFISHSSHDDDRAVEVRDWLIANRWDVLDLDPVRGLAPGERWQNALRAAADRCEAVLFLISPNWLSSRWCLSEFLCAKQLFPIGTFPSSTTAAEMFDLSVNDPKTGNCVNNDVLSVSVDPPTAGKYYGLARVGNSHYRYGGPGQ